jgi:hypothetical protein
MEQNILLKMKNRIVQFLKNLSDTILPIFLSKTLIVITSAQKVLLDLNSLRNNLMAKKKQKKEMYMGALEQQELFEDLIVNKEEQTQNEPEVVTTIQLTHTAVSIVKIINGSYSVVAIKFNPKEHVVSDVIEHIETNTDLFIIQERLNVLLFDIHNSVIED